MAAGTSPREALFTVVLPAALPSVLTGCRIGLVISCIVVFLAEMITSTDGLGHLLVHAARSFHDTRYAGHDDRELDELASMPFRCRARSRGTAAATPAARACSAASMRWRNQRRAAVAKIATAIAPTAKTGRPATTKPTAATAPATPMTRK